MTVLHREDADWCVSMTTTEKADGGRVGGCKGPGRKEGGSRERRENDINQPNMP